MADTPAHPHEMEEHVRTYRSFLRGTAMAILSCMFTLVALCAFAFGQTLPILLGWAVLILGHVSILIDLRSGSKTMGLSIVALIVFGLITAASV